MKKKLFTAVIVCFTVSAYAQKEVSSVELINQISEGKNLSYENVTIIGDVDLSKLGNSTETGKYPENGKTVYVFTNFVKQPVSFKNCTFKGRLNLCHKTESSNEKKEYRVEFTEDVIFQNCTFEKVADFELTNFDKAVSFEGAVFKEQPRFVRMGLYQKPNLDGLQLAKGCLFQFDQSKKEQVFTTKELNKIIGAMK
ncbi:MAG TPA: pentapeptide repeat-containing protein [Panacibacter sp.]|nr:pentapeptide repeat-containing protein [Panacibacter sp.]